MSHISRIDLVITSLSDLVAACRDLGFQFVPEQKSYRWYGRWVGDVPMPEGITTEDLGKCDHAIQVPGCDYEIGVVQRGHHYVLLWDNWAAGGLVEKIGPNAGLLKQAYSVRRIRVEARRKGYRIRERQMEQGVRMVVTV
jgi:hypothetical protein